MELINMTISECLEKRASETPDDIFIRSGKEIFTWETIDSIATKVAYLLTEQGIKKGDKVGVLGVNTASWVISFFAIQKLGAVAVLINSHYKEKELIDCIEISELKYLFYTTSNDNDYYRDTISALRKDRKTKHVKFYNMEHSYIEWINILSRDVSENHTLPDKIDPKDTACVLFTSGTTNLCKGVKLSHYSLVNNAREMVLQMRWNISDVMCLVVPLFHCFGISVSLLGSVIAGNSVTLVDKYKSLSVYESIEKHKCSILNGVPSMFLALVRNEHFKDYDLSSLKSGIIAGSPVFKDDYIHICEKLDGMKLQTSYGLTESSPCVSISDYNDPIEKKAISAGKIISNVEVKIMDLDTKEECQLGEVGEIYVKGYNVTSGYMSKDPVICDAVQPDGWLKTGDLAYKDASDYLYIAGRRKNLIIRGGENISPGEIEKYIKEVKKGLQVLVFGKKSEVLQEEIVACIEGKEDLELVNQIKEYLDKNLSRYKMPKYFVFMEHFPKNATGKIDEKKIKESVNEIL
ncbi:class I adenylate-forming enzyme family protein [Peptostreptococcus faecalis]|uniref:class I adenylate-forming enzyme family protein n=1 Tax=Peptostreptococcus faecalis TaxID=2045015 RepID=UPI000C7CA8F0|nr:class I adenylate-forming enzyme family protein [Peptostreptococcus faecalis]